MRKTILLIFSLFLGTLLFAQDKKLPKYGFEISNQGGFYKSDFQLTVRPQDGVQVFYTTDGSTPNSASIRYSSPITIKGEVSTIRLVGYLNGKRLEVNTQTYFVGRSHSLPVFSITTEPDNLWSAGRGIYAKGCCADTVQPYYGANFWKGWERPMNIEMYEPNGDIAINQPVGIRIFGGWSKGLPQKSLTVVARKKYGSSKIKYKLLPELDQKKYKTFILRNSGGDFNKAHLRDAFMTQLVEPIDLEIQEQRPAVVYLNGQYWGIQYIREKLNEHYIHEHFDVHRDSISLLKHRGDRQHGSKLNYPKMIQYLKTHSLADEKNMEYIESIMDVENYISYNIAETYSDNRDAGGNIRYWRSYAKGSKWRWIFFDLDLGLNSNSKVGHKRNTVKKFTSVNNEAWPDPPWSTLIIRRLLENPRMQELYINTFADYLNTIFKEETAEKLLNEMAGAIEKEMPYHKARWGGNMDRWNNDVDLVRTFIKERPKYLRQFIQEKFNLDGTVNIHVLVPDKNVAKVKLNSLKLKDEFKGIYFKNHPLNLEVKPSVDYEFVGWKELKSNELIYKFSPAGDMTLTPEFKRKNWSTLRGKVVINEVYNLKGGSWIELYNNSAQAIDVSGFKIRDDKDDHVFVLPAGTTIQPKGYLVVSETELGSDAPNIHGMEFSISDNDKVRFYDTEDYMIDEVDLEETIEDQGYIRVNPETFGDDNWVAGVFSMGKINPSYSKILNDRAEAEKQRKIILYSSIGGGVLLFVILLIVIIKRRGKRKEKLVVVL